MGKTGKEGVQGVRFPRISRIEVGVQRVVMVRLTAWRSGALGRDSRRPRPCLGT